MGGSVRGPQYATGGYISGPGDPGDDKIPELLVEPGCIIRADQARAAFGPLLDVLNHPREERDDG